MVDPQNEDVSAGTLRVGIRPRAVRADESLQCGLQILVIGWGSLVQNHEIDVETLHTPIFVSTHKLTNDFQIFGLIDSNQHNWQIARYSTSPKQRRTALTSLQHLLRRTQRWIRIKHAICQTLEQMCLVGIHSQMMQLHLRLRPRER